MNNNVVLQWRDPIPDKFVVDKCLYFYFLHQYHHQPAPPFAHQKFLLRKLSPVISWPLLPSLISSAVAFLSIYRRLNRAT